MKFSLIILLFFALSFYGALAGSRGGSGGTRRQSTTTGSQSTVANPPKPNSGVSRFNSQNPNSRPASIPSAPSPVYNPAPPPSSRPAPLPSYRPTPLPSYRPAPPPSSRPVPPPSSRPAATSISRLPSRLPPVSSHQPQNSFSHSNFPPITQNVRPQPIGGRDPSALPSNLPGHQPPNSIPGQLPSLSHSHQPVNSLPKPSLQQLSGQRSQPSPAGHFPSNPSLPAHPLDPANSQPSGAGHTPAGAWGKPLIFNPTPEGITPASGQSASGLPGQGLHKKKVSAHKYFDIFVLALSWTSDWHIHGLWPSKSLGGVVDFECNNWGIAFDRTQLQPIETTLKKSWPPENKKHFWGNYDFWQWEWDNHGRCAARIYAYPQDRPELVKEYFEKALSLYSSVGINDKLKAQGYGEETSKSNLELHNEIQAMVGKKVTLVYSGSLSGTADVFLKEIRVCYDTNWNLKDCPANSRTLTKKNENRIIRYPSINQRF